VEEKEMLKLYALIIVLGVLGGVGYGAMWYYQDTQARIATLRENNAKLEVAVQTAEESINTLQETMAKVEEANRQLQQDLQKAEAYGDDLRAKLRKHDLTALALKKPELLEGKMNGATANLWRQITEDTGGVSDDNLPSWLQSDADTRTESGSGDENREGADTNGSKTETSSVN
jgi:FtsZ-binding cell division protein ZapB